MKSDFSINVQVNVGVTPEVVALVTAILAHKPAIAGWGEEPQAQAQAEPKPQPEATAEPAASEQPKPQPEPEPQAEQPAEAPRELTVADVREAMHKTRQRIEGEDYKEHTDSEAYKKYHRVLNGVFKQIAALLGADLPSQLPPEQRQAFIDECELLNIQKDGTIGKDLAF